MEQRDKTTTSKVHYWVEKDKNYPKNLKEFCELTFEQQANWIGSVNPVALTLEFSGGAIVEETGHYIVTYRRVGGKFTSIKASLWTGSLTEKPSDDWMKNLMKRNVRKNQVHFKNSLRS